MRDMSPAPFVVGVGRSGTTLMRFMLDAHSELAIPPETGFLVDAARSGSWESFFDVLTTYATWPDFQMSRRELEGQIDTSRDFSAAEGARTFYQHYAARFGKSRWGDKTPMYCLHMTDVSELLPEARFVHVIRDGRDVAASVRHLWFSPGQSMASIAEDWRYRIEQTRAQAARLRHYREVRYEDLVSRPEDVLRATCDYLDLSYEPRMHLYYERAPNRLKEHVTRHRPDGSVLVTHQQRVASQRMTMQPPDQSRVGAWRSVLSETERREFEGVAIGLLRSLNYL